MYLYAVYVYVECIYIKKQPIRNKSASTKYGEVFSFCNMEQALLVHFYLSFRLTFEMSH